LEGIRETNRGFFSASERRAQVVGKRGFIGEVRLDQRDFLGRKGGMQGG